MSIITKSETKEYLRIDTNVDDSLIEMQIVAAEAMLKNSTKTDFDDTNKLAKLYCLMLVQHMYEERTYTAPKNEQTSLMAQSLLLQLKYCYPVDEEEAT